VWVFLFVQHVLYLANECWASDHTEHQPVAFPGSLCCLWLPQMSAGGLEEYTQLCMKWGKIVPLYLGSDWRTQLQELLSLPPGECPGFQSIPLPAKGYDGVHVALWSAVSSVCWQVDYRALTL